jgi:hypothetical protein
LLSKETDDKKLEDPNISRRSIIDKEGNLHLLESEVTNEGGH